MFTGYSEKVGDFFWELRFNNSREWFAPRREEFRQLVMEPTKALANELYDWLQEVCPELGLNLHISRIYRDARRLFGRGPLKDEIWFSFQNEIEHRDGAPNLWFEVGAEGYGMGFGYWMRAADAMRYRKFVDQDPAAMEKLARQFARQTQFALCGEEYARPKGHADDVLAPWYNRRWIGLRCAQPYDAVSASRELLAFAEAGFGFLLPYYRYFDKVYRMAD